MGKNLGGNYFHLEPCSVAKPKGRKEHCAVRWACVRSAVTRKVESNFKSFRIKNFSTWEIHNHRWIENTLLATGKKKKKNMRLQEQHHIEQMIAF